MANTFKNAALADVNNAAYDTLYTAPASTTTVVLGLAVANKSSQSVEVTRERKYSRSDNARNAGWSEVHPRDG